MNLVLCWSWRHRFWCEISDFWWISNRIPIGFVMEIHGNHWFRTKIGFANFNIRLSSWKIIIFARFFFLNRIRITSPKRFLQPILMIAPYFFLTQLLVRQQWILTTIRIRSGRSSFWNKHEQNKTDWRNSYLKYDVITLILWRHMIYDVIHVWFMTS